MLAGTNGVVREVLPITNEARNPARFRMQPDEQVRAFNQFEAQGWELLGIFHSHPDGPPRPSETDVAEAAYEVVHIIWSRSHGSWQANGFWIEHGRVSEVKLYIADGELAPPNPL